MQPCSPLLRFAFVAALLCGTVPPAFADDDLSGAYLAARLATSETDYAAATSYYDRLLLAEPGNAAFQEGSLLSHVATGDYDRAAALAGLMVQQPNASQFAVLVTLAADARSGAFDKGIALLDGGAVAGELVAGVYRAWALAGEGKMADATKAFDKLVANKDLAPFATYHKALALAMVGDYEGAEKLFSGPLQNVLNSTRRGILAHVEILSRLERNPDAITLLDKAFGGNLDPELAALHERLTKGEMVPFTIVPTPKDGVAEMFLTVGQVLNNDKQPLAIALLHARLAEWLRPDLGDAALLSAAILGNQKQFDLAIKTFAAVLPESPVYPAAQLGLADALVQQGNHDAAIDTLQQFTRARPDLVGGWLALGDNLRQKGDFKAAAAAYDKVVALIPTPGPGDWFPFFARGISRDKSGDWPGAEADMREALKLAPEQPSVLNYLGYSYVERKQNLDEALDMIKRAVAAKPDEGYITDSLGWAYYRLGRYDEAVKAMEKAVDLDPTEPLLNDHLGDVYWAVGRRDEAAFQWHRALNLPENPDDDMDKARIRRKLEVGLDQVLKDEGAPPLKPANGN